MGDVPRFDAGGQGKGTAMQGACTGCFAECIRANSIESQHCTTKLLLSEEIKKNEDAEMKLQESNVLLEEARGHIKVLEKRI